MPMDATGRDGTLSVPSVGSGEKHGTISRTEKAFGKARPQRVECWLHTSPQCQDVLQAQTLSLVQMARDLFLALTAAGHVQDGLQATGVHSSAGNCHGGGLLVGARVSCWVPGHVYEEGAACPHLVKSVGNFFLKRGSWGHTSLRHIPMGSGS